MPKTVRRKPPTIRQWADAKKLIVYRSSPCKTYVGPIDAGVNFFVLKLEELGASTEYSCEGHPAGFYIVFCASLKLANDIHSCGFFTVEIEGENRWSILPDTSVPHKDAVLAMAAISWVKKFGPICRYRVEECLTGA